MLPPSRWPSPLQRGTFVLWLVSPSRPLRPRNISFLGNFPRAATIEGYANEGRPTKISYRPGPCSLSHGLPIHHAAPPCDDHRPCIAAPGPLWWTRLLALACLPLWSGRVASSKYLLLVITSTPIPTPTPAPVALVAGPAILHLASRVRSIRAFPRPVWRRAHTQSN